ncbi:hypothetical protein ABT030_07510 [Streptomyces mirabilis]|uniref:hypothetical protein n=1 Tax=Streptomyces mirabilis TaxID=68239 RepID=UPI0033317DE7
MPGPETASDPSSPTPATSPGPDTASEVVRWAAFSCVLVPVVLVGFGTSLAGAAGAALGLAAVTGACLVLLRQSERVAARLRADVPAPPRARHSRTRPHVGAPHHHHGRPGRRRRGRTEAPRGEGDPRTRDRGDGGHRRAGGAERGGGDGGGPRDGGGGAHRETARAEGTTPGARSPDTGARSDQSHAARDRNAEDRNAGDRNAGDRNGRDWDTQNRDARDRDARDRDTRNPDAGNPDARNRDTRNPDGQDPDGRDPGAQAHATANPTARDRPPGNLAERDGPPENLITWDRVPQSLITWDPSGWNRGAQDPDTRVRDARDRDTRDQDTQPDAPRGGVPPERPARHRGTQDLADSHMVNGLRGSSGSGAHRGGRHGEGMKPVD